MNHSCILDIGVHNGDDSAFYLAKGFKVVGIEANPRLAAAARDRFAAPIAEGRYQLVEAAIAPRAGTIDFIVNLDKDDWSSTDPRYGARDGTRHERISVPAIVIESVLERHPDIHYLKCDIEGGDLEVLRGMLRSPVRPRYCSFELHDTQYLAYLAALGYTKFKIVNQNLNWLTKLPNPPREGVFVEHVFGAHSSGPFGEETVGQWLSLDDASELHLTLTRIHRQYPGLLHGWYDVHATRE